MIEVEPEVEFGLEHFGAERKVELPLRDALYAYKAIGEFIAFFHDPDKHATIEQVEKFIGDNRKGGCMFFGRHTITGSLTCGRQMSKKRLMMDCWTAIRSWTNKRTTRCTGLRDDAQISYPASLAPRQ